MSRTYAVLNNAGQPIGGTTQQPAIKLLDDQRVSVIDLYSDDKEWPAEVHFHGKKCEAVVSSEKYVCSNNYHHVVRVVGTDPVETMKMVEKIAHIFGAVDRDVDFPEKKLFLPEIGKFWDRVSYFWNWLIFGKDITTK